jgi:ribonuclease Z
MSSTKIALLGTGNPNPDPNHSGPSVAIIVDDTPYIVDFGPGLIRQAAALTPQYGGDLPALEPRNLKKAFLTHLHSDHTVGYPDLILTPWVMGRDQPLEVHGPKGTLKLTSHILEAYKDDIQYRLFGLEPANSQGWRVQVHEFKEGLIYDDKYLQVETFLVKHGSWPNAYGMRFTTPDKVIVISGDTAPCENIRKFSQGADILLHEVYCHKPFEQQDPVWQNYHIDHHTSTLELAALAKETQPGLLVLYHTLFWGATEEDIRAEISRIYDGEVVIGKDLQVLP